MYLLHTITGVTDAQKLNQGPKGPSSLVTCGFNECIRVSLFSVAKLESITSYEPPELNCVRLCQLSSRVRIARSAISLLKVYDHVVSAGTTIFSYIEHNTRYLTLDFWYITGYYEIEIVL